MSNAKFDRMNRVAHQATELGRHKMNLGSWRQGNCDASFDVLKPILRHSYFPIC